MRSAIRLMSVFLLMVLATGCVVEQRGHRGRGDRGPAGWEMLGRRNVDFRGDRDVIEVGRREGRFSELKFEVHGGRIELYGMRVFFSDGSVFSPDTRFALKDRNQSRVLNLPGDRRVIQRVEFLYESEGRREATLTLYGR